MRSSASHLPQARRAGGPQPRARQSAAGNGRRPLIAAGIAFVLALVVMVGPVAWVVTDSLEYYR
jgi:hypothetical protein